MFKTMLMAALATVAAAIGPGQTAMAVTLSDVTLDLGTAVGSGPTDAFYEPIGGTVLSFFAPVISESGLSSGNSALGASFNLTAAVGQDGSATADPLGLPDLVLSDFSGPGNRFEGDLIDASFGPAIGGFGPGFQLLLSSLGGTLAADFGPYAVLTFAAAAGQPALTAPTDLPNPTALFGVTGTLSLNRADLATVPAPPAAALILLGLASLALCRRLIPCR